MTVTARTPKQSRDNPQVATVHAGMIYRRPCVGLGREDEGKHMNELTPWAIELSVPLVLTQFKWREGGDP